MLSSGTLFSPVTLGSLNLKHRVVMPPMSRLRAHWPSGNPSDLMREHYTQRASEGGLVIAEGTAISPAARPYHTAPGIWSDSQVERWKAITRQMHAKGSLVVLQLYHAGRATSTANSGVEPVSASVNPAFWQNPNVVVSTIDGLTLPSPHRELAIEEIEEIVDQFHAAAVNAKRAGFDGIEILAGQGHLVEQFLHDSSNTRVDAYGGSFENRERFLMEVLEAVIPVWGPGRVAVRISPSSTFNGMGDSDPRGLYRHLAVALNRFELAYLSVIEPRISGSDTVDNEQPPVATAELRALYRGAIIAGGGFTPESAERAVSEGLADAVAIGRHFTSNPDLPQRVQYGLPLTHYERETFYAFDSAGYTDFCTYDALDSAVAAA